MERLPKRAVIVTGLCRSGAATVAEVCHILGYTMGRTFNAPIAPDFRLDWEDAGLSNALAGGLASSMHDHVRDRANHAMWAARMDRLGFKGALLQLNGALPALRDALRAYSYEHKTIAVHRDPAARDASIERQPGAAVMREWNARILEAPAVLADWCVQYEALIDDTPREVATIATLLGVTDKARIHKAIAAVRRPCTPARVPQEVS